MCFDMKKNCTVIIDNSKRTDGDDITVNESLLSVMDKQNTRGNVKCSAHS